MRELSNHAVLSMSSSTMAVSSKYTQDLSVQTIFFTFSCKWFLCFYFWAVIWSYIVNFFAALYELASASAHTLLKFASSVRALLKPYGDTLRWLPTVLTVSTPEKGWRTQNEVFASTLGLSSWHSQWRLATHLGFHFRSYEYIAACCHGNKQSQR